MTDERHDVTHRTPHMPGGRPTADRNTRETSARTSSARADWLVPAALILLSAIPVLAAAIRVAELSGGAEITPSNARFFAAPVPVMVHVISASVYSVAGAFQFSAGLRRRRRGWHRTVGRILVPCGLAAALSGLWMTRFYPLPASDGDLLAAFRYVFGSAMALSIVLGVAAIRRRDFARHGAWMTRAYTIALGAGTQALTFATWSLVVGESDQLSRALLMGAGWVINLAVAEWVIRRRPAGHTRTSVPAVPQPA